MDIESQWKGVHALSSTRGYGRDRDDMPDLDTAYSLQVSSDTSGQYTPTQRPVTTSLQQTLNPWSSKWSLSEATSFHFVHLFHSPSNSVGFCQ